MAKKDEIPRTIGTTDDVARAIIDDFKRLKKYTTHSEALEKLLMRAEKLNLHLLTDEEFKAVVSGVSELQSVGK